MSNKIKVSKADISKPIANAKYFLEWSIIYSPKICQSIGHAISLSLCPKPPTIDGIKLCRKIPIHTISIFIHIVRA